MCQIFALTCIKSRFHYSKTADNFQSRKMKIKRNFFNLCNSTDFQESIFECQLGTSLGLTRRCYLCDHYVQNIAVLPDCESSCKCKKSRNRKELVKHLCERIFRLIDARERENNDIFITGIGMKQVGSKPKLFAEYMTPIAASRTVSDDRLNLQTFVGVFQDCTGSRLKHYKN